MWKDAFENVKTELDLAIRKKHALDDLLDSGKIARFTYDCLNKDLNKEINHIEIRHKALTEKITNKLSELEEQKQTLEFFLANSEMAYAAGETNDEIRSKECSAISLGLDAVQQELNWIREVITHILPKEETLHESAKSAIESVEATPTPIAENTPIDEVTAEEQNQVAVENTAEEQN
jgi:hypothetical protein